MTQSSSSSFNEIEQGNTLTPRYNDQGLVTAVVQDATSHEILMLAHMNSEALQLTIDTGKAHFWSRSRKSLWMKGETSGNVLMVEEILIDCDQDALVIKANLTGDGACHTGVRSCFYRKIVQTSGQSGLARISE